MITAGIDVGAASTKAVIMDGDKILAKYRQLAEGEEEQVINAAFEGALSEAGLTKDLSTKSLPPGLVPRMWLLPTNPLLTFLRVPGEPCFRSLNQGPLLMWVR